PGSTGSVQRTLLYGAGWAGVIVARSAERDTDAGVIPVGFLDDDLELKDRRVGGLPVFGGIQAMAGAKRATGATSLLITMPRASGATVRKIVEAAMELGLEVRTVPPMTDLLDGTLDATRIRRVHVEDLLRRPIAGDHAPAVTRLLEDRTVLITGAAGSIGSELARQVLAVGASHIVLLDHAESPLYLCLRDMESRAQALKGSKPNISAHLLDVSDATAMTKLMNDMKPSVVFHAAAYKHVPLLEEHSSQAVKVNIGGTMALVDAAVANGVEHFVLVSTDKAVWPSSVMGASKRAAEMIVADAARRTGKAYVAVRFGNVLGSNGSVIPIFQEQLETGQPLTITDPDMTRYFMTIPEAAWLILDAAAIAESGGLYVLDMGEPVRIMDIAHDLVRLSGRDPESVPIKIVGLRSGEKLHEELFYDEERARPTAVPKVLRATSQEPPEHLRNDLIGLLALAQEDRPDDLRRTLHEYVRASVQADEGTWGKTSEKTGRPSEKGTRPVVVVPVERNGRALSRNGFASSAAKREPADDVVKTGAA
ncbi:MAG: polysaccharide biosynthesis protein, partial [Chloroflexota bacterium]